MYLFHLHSFGTFDETHPVGPACWGHFDLFCLHSGSVGLTLAGSGPLELVAGDAVLIYPHTPFSGNCLSREAVASVQHFSIAVSPVTSPPEPLQDLPSKADGFEVYRDLSTALTSDVTRAVNLASSEPSGAVKSVRMALHTLILLQLRCGVRESPGVSGRSLSPVAATAAWAQARESCNLTAKDLAEHAGLSPSRFRDRFKSERGESPGQFLKNLRLNEGKRLLRETRLPIKAVARHCGYGDIVAFSRAFQRRFGTTPARYRREAAPRG